ncbi:hypothetical protein TSACC_21756 [Terrimicrobium sacchariphilum]|uniref:Uncharacterized protein n=1 Tax=Terrimicrobium sacchariphilum TaxID=690879 RepID=A0A146G764_TERSA|nr:hypothetical protein TSACC_21756 [Terrimicrobium sacchariphilum]
MAVDQGPPPSHPSHWWNGCIARLLPNLRFFCIGVLGFRRTSLKKKRGQHNVNCHLKKLALPIFKDSFPKISTSQIGSEADRRLVVQPILFVGILPPDHRLSSDRTQENQGQNQGQAVVPNDLEKG